MEIVSGPRAQPLAADFAEMRRGKLPRNFLGSPAAKSGFGSD